MFKGTYYDMDKNIITPGIYEDTLCLEDAGEKYYMADFDKDFNLLIKRIKKEKDLLIWKMDDYLAFCDIGTIRRVSNKEIKENPLLSVMIRGNSKLKNLTKREG